MNHKLPGLLFWLLILAAPTHAQYIGVSGGGLFPRDRGAQAPSGAGGSALADFRKSAILGAEAGIGIAPFLAAGVHYSFSRPELFLQRGDAFRSSALVELPAHTLTLEGRLRTPEAFDFRFYGLVGGGFSHFNLDVKRQIEVPFPGGAPRHVTAPVFTFGGGIERKVAPFARLKVEVRDYVTPIPERFFVPGGAWHRIAVLGGLVLGR